MTMSQLINSGLKRTAFEIKNKHNTTKGNHKVAIYDDLQHSLEENYPGFKAYYVEVIPKNKKTYDKLFVPSDNTTHIRRKENQAIRVIDGKSFYALATGDPEALAKLYKVLPRVIGDILGKKGESLKEDAAFQELFEKVY